MFEIDRNRATRSDIAVITDNYQVLLYYDEPILYSGTNKLGNWIIGSSVDEDRDKEFERYFHVVVDSGQYNRFLSQAISFRSILEGAKSFFVIDKSFDNETVVVYNIDYESVPQEYLPSDTSFCPKQVFKSSLSYVVSLKGKMADLNRAFPQELREVIRIFSNILKSPFDVVDQLKLSSEISIPSFSPGSFRIEFLIDFTNIQPTLFFDPEKYSKYLHQSIHFNLHRFADEIDAILDGEDDNTEFFGELIQRSSDLYRAENIEMTDQVKSELRRRLFDQVINSSQRFEELCELIGDHFNHIELANYVDNVKNLVGVIDNDFRNRIERTNTRVEERISKVTIDEVPQSYKLLIYHLNTDSRKGNAYIESAEPEIMDKPKIMIQGDQSLERSKYSESLHINKFIHVRGIAKRVNDHIKYIKIVD